ncbi:amino acid permease [Candidatus Uabimicrobium amorphum]|uniref:Amino acid transporter n=1 Tax=Uabimicrobium amorphum TaxID=2596890 RepID=A0A5S9IM06_UABAM|nr:amino acid permease [Candidatus Uabimicrobium amorphum]BBM83510.1 amino acid transporter [Candidatus Uabimicrobium amorphum]
MLKKNLRSLDVFCLATGTMISSGLFVLPGIAFEKIGPAIIVAYGLAALFVIPAMFSKIELATAMPKAGGSYFFIERSLGPLMGTFSGFLNWLSIALKAGFALIGIGTIGAQFLPFSQEVGIKLVAISSCIVLTIINLVSVKSVGRLQAILVFSLLGILSLHSFSGIIVVESAKYSPFLHADLQTLFAVAGMIFFSFGGLTKVASVSEEIHNPGRSLPRGMFASFAVVSFFYVFIVFITVGTVEASELSGSLIPIALSAEQIFGERGIIAIEAASLLAFVTTANAGILSASRSPLAMSEDGLLPEVFSHTNKWFDTPHISIFFTSGFIILVVGVLSIENLVKTASTMMILLFILVNISVIVMRSSKLQSYQPVFHSPFYPWLQIIAIVLYTFLIFEMGIVPLLMTAIFALLTGFWYIGYVGRRIDRESAFVYMVKSITAKDIDRSDLEDELRHISLERHGVELDHFDHVIKESLILDIEEAISGKELFRRMSVKLSQRLNIDEEVLYQSFLKRERESSTVVNPGLAIPHVIVDGQNIFDILLVRCKGGVTFSELHQPVKMIIVLIGSADQYDAHLRALMSIAHLVKNPKFKDGWLHARNKEQLRDVVLLLRPREGLS